MKIFNIIVTLAVVAAASINAYAQEDFFGNTPETRYFNGVLLQTQEHGQILSLVNPWIRHSELLKEIEQQNSKVTKILWAGEFEVLINEDGSILVTRANETAGLIRDNKDVGSNETENNKDQDKISTKDLFENPGQAIKNLQKYINRHPDIKEKYFLSTSYIKYNDKELHLDEKLTYLSTIRHDLFAELSNLFYFAHYYEELGLKDELAVDAAKNIQSMYETIFKADDSYYISDWEDLKPKLDLIISSDDIRSLDLINIADNAMEFKSKIWTAVQDKVNKTFTFTPLRTPELFKKSLDKDRKEVFENRIIKKKKTIKALSEELGVSFASILNWQNSLRSEYKKYLKSGELPNGYTLIDQKELDQFADNVLKSPEDRYILKNRVATSDPLPIDQVTEDINKSSSTIYRKEETIKSKLDQYLQDPSSFIKFTSEEEKTTSEQIFTKTLTEQEKAIFEQRIIAKDPKTLLELSGELGGISTTNIARWENKIRENYDNYLKIGVIPNKYVLLDPQVLTDFSSTNLEDTRDKYILGIRIASNSPQTLEETARILSSSSTTVSRREAAITKKLDKYLELMNNKATIDGTPLEKVLQAQVLGQEEFDLLFKGDAIELLLKAYNETKSPMDALRLLVVEKIRRQYISYSNTPTGPTPTLGDLTLRKDIAKIDIGEDGKDYRSIKELKETVQKIEIDKLDLRTEEEKRLKEEYEKKLDLKKVEVKK